MSRHGGITMNFYITSGSMDFMKSLRKKYANEHMIVMDGKGNSLLLHETKNASVFQSPMKYTNVSSFGPLEEKGFFALHHLPVTDEGRPIFEHWMLSRIDSINQEPGLIAYRFLRPKSSNTYIFLTEWTKKVFFNLWTESISYQQVIKEIKSGAGLERKPHMFSSAPYITHYKAKLDE